MVTAGQQNEIEKRNLLRMNMSLKRSRAWMWEEEGERLEEGPSHGYGSQPSEELARGLEPEPGVGGPPQ